MTGLAQSDYAVLNLCSHGLQTNAFCSHTNMEPIDCTCGEEETEFAWVWSLGEDGGQVGSVVLGEGQRQITFNPEYSTGTATVRGHRPLSSGHHHYWELKMTLAVYGTDIMVGVCTSKCNLRHGLNRFCSLLGRDTESWGYSYTGWVRHNGEFRQFGPRWGKGSIVGLHLDSWRGTLSLFLNRKPLGVAFTGLQNKEIFPIVCSTSAHSGMKLVTSCTFPSNLQFLASEAMFTHLQKKSKVRPEDVPVPPGLRSFIENNWPFLRALGKEEKCKDAEGREGLVDIKRSGSKHPHDESEEYLYPDRARAKRLRRRLYSHPSSPSYVPLSLHPFSLFSAPSSPSPLPSVSAPSSPPPLPSLSAPSSPSPLPSVSAPSSPPPLPSLSAPSSPSPLPSVSAPSSPPPLPSLSAPSSPSPFPSLSAPSSPLPLPPSSPSSTPLPPFSPSSATHLLLHTTSTLPSSSFSSPTK
ncbi:hypothetical protein Pmani_032855 [Petrolisthes manimaculis]|uniref:B30.2/SPRY domain-containing protein n=1 Tax=Petrolisthes manimaculis TaxID=1843537 RepID=A0AAE1TQN7_9EUCA|nr:hypothetical protein Pmani_032855 [Petrolisthes manimaculis]